MVGSGNRLDQFLKALVDMDGTDLFVTVGSPAVVGAGKEMRAVSTGPLTPEFVEDLVRPLLTGEREAAFYERPDLDAAYTVPGVGRFRVNVFRQRGHFGLVARRIKTQVPNLEDLGLPKVLKDMAQILQTMGQV